MVPETPNHHSEILPPLKPWYRRPLVLGGIAVTTLFGVSLWSYATHPDWLMESDQTNAMIERILQMNPTLTRADLEQDARMDNLSFWFGRSDQEYRGVQIAAAGEEEAEEETSLLEQFMTQNQANEQAASNAAAPVDTSDAASDRATANRGPQTLDSTTEPTETRSALDIAINGLERESAALSPLQAALRQVQNSAETVSLGSPQNDSPGTSALNAPQTSIYETNTGIPSSERPTGRPTSSTRTSRYGTPPAVAPEPFVPRSRRESPFPEFDPSAFGNTTAPNPNNTTTNPNALPNSQRRSTGNPLDGSTYNRIGNGEIDTFADPLGTND